MINKIITTTLIISLVFVFLSATEVKAQEKRTVTMDVGTVTTAPNPEGLDFKTEIQTQKAQVIVTAKTKDFSSTQEPTFNLDTSYSPGFDGIKQRGINLLNSILDVFSDNESQNDLKVEVIDHEGKVVETQEVSLNTTDNITVDNVNLEPGKYSLKITDQVSGTSTSQDFTWGVLAINTDKDIYDPNTKVNFAIAVLNEYGDMVCDAKVQLTVTSPSGTTEVLSTENSGIKTNESCYKKEYTLIPDYEAGMKLGSETGTYQMTLTADTNNGTYTISDIFEVSNNYDFQIERVAPTRIFPPVDYPVVLKIKANKNYKGKVTDKLSDKFRFYYATSEELNGKFGIDVEIDNNATSIPAPIENDLKMPTWEVDWEKGKTYYLAYWFNAPDKSPDFYLLGNLDIGGYLEKRPWQLAIDLNATLYPDGNVTTGNWITVGTCTLGEYDCIEEGTTSPDDTNYIYTSPNPTNTDHVHTASNSPAETGTVTQIDFRVRAKKDPSNKTASVDIYYSTDGSDPSISVGQITTSELTGTFQTFTKSATSLSLTKAQIDALRVKLRANGTAGGAPWVSAAEYYITYGVATDSWTGIAYTNEGTTPDTSATICARVNNTTEACDATDGSGVFVITTINANAGDQITFFYDGGTEFGNTITVSDGGNIVSGDNLKVYQGVVMVRHETGSNIAISNMAAYDSDNNPTDIFYTANTTLAVLAGFKFYVYSDGTNNFTFDPGNTVTTNGSTGDFNVNGSGTAYLDTATNTISGDIIASGSATLNIDANTNITGGDIITTGTSATITTSTGTPTITLTSNGGSIGGGTTPTLTFHHLTTTGSGATTLSNTATANGNVTVGTATTLNVNADLSIAGNFANTTTGIINTTSGTPIVTLTGSASMGGGSGAITLHHLATSGTGTSSFTGSGTNTINGNITVGSGTTLNINSSISVAGNFTNTTTGIIGNSAGTPTVTMTNNTSSSLGGGSGAITIYNLATTGTGTHTFTGSGTNTISNNVSVGAGTTLNINSNLSVGGNLQNTTSGVIGTSAGTPTVTFTGSAAIGGGTTGAVTFYHLATTGTGTHNFSNGGTNTINGNVTVGTGTTLNINSPISIAGNLVNTTTGIIGYSGTPTVTMTGTSNSIGGGSGAIDFYTLTINPSSAGTITANSDLTVDNTLTVSASDKLTIAASKFVTISSTGSLTLTNEIDGTGTLIFQPASGFPTGGTMTAPVQFDATGASQTIANRTYTGNVELYNNSGAARTYTFGTAGGQTLTFSGDLTLNGNSGTVSIDADNYDPTVNVTGDISYTAAGSAESITTGTGTWTVGGNVNFTNGTFTATATNTFIMNGASDPTSDVTSNGQTFVNFEVQTNTVTSLDTMDVNGAFDVSSGGTFIHGGGADSDLYIADDFTLASGTTFTWNTEATSQVIFDGDLFLADNTAVKQNLGDVVIGSSPDTTYLSADTSSNSLAVTSADFYYTCGHEVDIGNGGITIDGTFDATSDEAGCSVYDEADPETTINDLNLFNLSGTGTFVPDQSTIIFDDASGTNNLTTAGTGSFYNMEVNGAANIMVLQDALDVDNDLTITQGELDAGSAYQINVGGDWTNNATFDHQNGKVVLDGTSSVNLDSGCADYDTCTNEDFYDLEINKTAGTDDVTLLNTHLRVGNNLTITDGELIQGTLNVRVEDTSASGTAVTVTSNGTWTNTSTGDLKLGGGFSNSNVVTFQGNGSGCGDNDDLAIASTDTTDRNWSGSGTFNINDVTCSDQISTPAITAYSSTNSGSTCGANWNFVGCPISVSGTVYDAGTSNPLGECTTAGGDELKMQAGGLPYTTACANDGTYTFSGVGAPSAGEAMVIWLDDDYVSETDGALVVRYDGSGDSTGNDFYDETVVVTSDDTNPADIADMDTYDNGNDADIPYTATATPTLSVNSGYELFVDLKSGVAGGSDVFDPGGTVTIVGPDDLHIDDGAKAYLDTATNDLNGDIVIDTGATLSIDADTTISGATSGNITATGALATSGTPDVTISVNSSISGGGTVNFYDLSLATTGTTTINTTTTVANSVDVGAGTTLTVGANLNIDSTSGTGGLKTTTSGIIGYSGTPTVDIDNQATLGGGSGEIKFYNLDLGDGVSDTTTLSSTIIIENSLTVNTNQLFAMGTNDVTVGATGVSGSGDVTHNGTSSQAASGTFTIKSSSGGTAQFSGAGELNLYNLTLGDGATSITVDNESDDIVIDIANNFNNTTGSTFQASSTAGFYVGGNWTNSGTFTSGTGMLTMNAQDSGNTMNGTMTGSSSFNNLTFDDGGTPGDWTFAANPATVNNNFNILSGSVTAPSDTLTIGGNFNNSDSFSNNSGTIVFNDNLKTSTLTYTATTTFNNFTVATGGKQMEFDNTDGVVTDIDGALTLQGTGCDADRILLDPDSPGLVWDIAASGSVDIDYIDVEYSAASPGVTANNSTEQNNNNTGWTINAGICGSGAKESRFLDGVRVRGEVRVK